MKEDSHTTQQFDLIQGCLCVVLGALHHFHRHKVFHPVRTQRRVVISDLKYNYLHRCYYAKIKKKKNVQR